ncbi:MAG: hypothetical protein AUI57_03095 [Candidatus Rokubacteria bacterium 13_1_40CM_2_68_8]|nr:MAG: hypothetical protein AUI57_03095 [Candidatus Rokubacteria bacterium 13_1_40CM_2_68_8]
MVTGPRTIAWCLAIMTVPMNRTECESGMRQRYPMVSFTLSDLPSVRSGTLAWVATYGSEEDRARFEIELVLPEPRPRVDTEITGMLRRHGGTSRPNAFLADLLKAHGEEDVAVETPHLDSLRFLATVLGTGLRPDSGPRALVGHFAKAESGTWILLRLLLGTRRPTASQILLALDPDGGHGALIPAGREFTPAVLSVFGGLLLDAAE